MSHDHVEAPVGASAECSLRITHNAECALLRWPLEASSQGEKVIVVEEPSGHEGVVEGHWYAERGF